MPADNWKVSPRYTMNELREGSIQPIDVFEDAIKGWILGYAAKLVALNEDNAGIAVMILVAAYPETIECYSTGEDSKQKLKKFFTGGMKLVFPELAGAVPDKDLESICDDVRIGLYHASMLQGSVELVPAGPAIEYLPNEHRFRINPFAFFQRVNDHFAAYIARVRSAAEGDVERSNFIKFWNYRYSAPNQPSGIVPMVDPGSHEFNATTRAPDKTAKWVQEI